MPGLCLRGAHPVRGSSDAGATSGRRRGGHQLRALGGDVAGAAEGKCGRFLPASVARRLKAVNLWAPPTNV